MPNGDVARAQKEAAAAGLRYVQEEGPGISRRRRGRGWSYTRPDGTLVRDRAQRDRIARLAIPPAWTDVWICPDPRGHIQATGRDARGRKQYRYHSQWKEVRDETKFGRMIRFGEALPRIRRRVDEALRKRDLTREKVLATVVRLLEITCIRVGNHQYKRENGTFGLTTLRNRHVRVFDDGVFFRFKGKGGQPIEAHVDDRRLARIIRECQDIPGYELFQYFDDEGRRTDVRSEDVNEYLREISGDEFTAKDFRTWMATLHAFAFLSRQEPVDSEKELHRHRVAAIDHVADQLRNTRTVCRTSYVHPAVLRFYGSDVQKRHYAPINGTRRDRQRAAELKLLRLLRAAGTNGNGNHPQAELPHATGNGRQRRSARNSASATRPR
jgi:DNA topoisomerase-1